MPISVKRPRSFPLPVAPLRALITRALALERCRAGDIGVVIANDALLRDLNRGFRGIDRATDVLSFLYDEAEEAAPGEACTGSLGGSRGGSRGDSRGNNARVVDGDVVISLDRLLDQARRYRVTPGRELARLVIHGTLHLAGLDHDREADRRRMRSRERKALREGRDAIRMLEMTLRCGRSSGSAAG
ncbi:MAG: rRNA maturation RNase YbeY [Candidatus Eisenbacteria bacterium]|nr:rRNA maturation RNase YbeY [Candidatus Eisenbacteria bacterium]